LIHGALIKVCFVLRVSRHYSYLLYTDISSVLGTALVWVMTQRVVVISYRHCGTTYRAHLQVSRIQKKSCGPNAEFIRKRVWAMRSVSVVWCQPIGCLLVVGWRGVW